MDDAGYIHASNGPTEVANAMKRVKRVAFGSTSFRNYRIRTLLYAGKPGRAYSPPSHPADIRRALLAGLLPIATKSKGGRPV